MNIFCELNLHFIFCYCLTRRLQASSIKVMANKLIKGTKIFLTNTGGRFSENQVVSFEAFWWLWHPMTRANSLTWSCTCTPTTPSLETGGFLRCQEACGWLLVAHKRFCPKWPSRRHQGDNKKTPPVVSHAGSSPVLVDASLAGLSFPRKKAAAI